MVKDLTSIRDLDYIDIIELLDLGQKLKNKQKLNETFQPLLGKSILNNFPAASLSTRITFETGIYQLGAQVVNLPIKFDGKEAIQDIIGYLNNWIHGLVIRYPE